MKRLLVNQSLFRGRWFIVTLAFLLLPLGLWAEEDYYNITVANIGVNSGNRLDILEDGGSVQFDGTNTLTLNGATINGNIVSGLSSLTVHLKGRNVIHNQETAFRLATSNASLSFTFEDKNAVLLTDATTDAAFAYNEGQGQAVQIDYNNLPDGYLLSYDAELKRCLGKYYGIDIYAFTNGASTLGPQNITAANCNRLAGSYDESTQTWDNSVITLSYDDSSKTLTLNNMNLESANDCYLFRITDDQAKNITINLRGNNKLRQHENYGSGFLTSDYYDGIVTITTDSENPGSLTMVDLPEGNPINAAVTYKNGLAYSKEGSTHYIKVPPVSYNLLVNGEQVTSENKANVLGDVQKSVSYNSDTKTLTLKGTSISSISAGEDTELKVYLVGYNEIGGMNYDYAFDYEGNAANLTFETSKVFPGTLTCFSSNLARTGNIAYKTDLALHDGEICVANENLKPIYFAGYVSNEGNDDFLYAKGGDFCFTKVGFQGSTPIVSTKEGETTAAMWASYLTDANLLQKVYFQFDWGECNNKAVTIQLKGITNGEEDGQVYSSPISLSTANEDGILEIELNKAMTSENIKFVLSSDGAFSFVPLSVGYQYIEGYDITVANTQVTDQNKGDVLGNGTVSYDDANHTLILNNAAITGGIEWNSSANLKIRLNGENSITCSGETSAIKATVSDVYPALTFVKDENATSASLTLTVSNSANTISGFNYPVNHENLFMINSENETVSTTLVTSTILSGGSGSSSDPLIIKTADDLKNFSEYINGSVIPNTSCAKLSNDISEDGLDCSSVTVNPIGYGNTFFAGTFDGNGKTIKNLIIADNVGDCAGFFRILGENGVIKNLTLDNLTLSGGNSSSNNIGGLVAYLNGGTINNCTIKNSTISCKNDTQSPTVGGLVGKMNSGSITNSIVQTCTVNAVTQEPNSGPVAHAGGIVGSASGGTISGCQVKGKTTVKADYGAYSADNAAGAIVGNRGGNATLSMSDNSYEYNVTVLITKYDGSATSSITMSGYDQRAIGGRWDYNQQIDSYEYVASEDVSADNGAVLYTKTVILPTKTENNQVTIEGRQGNYYVMADNGYRVAPGQEVTLDVTPNEDGYVITSFTVTNKLTSEQIPTTSTADNAYTFTMPDSDVEVNATAEAPKVIKVAGVTVNEDNAENITGSNITGEGTVSFNAETNTLTLTGDVLIGDGGIEWGIDDDLTIQFSGTQNSITAITTSAVYCTEGNTGHQLRLVEGSQSGTCQLSLSAKSGTPIIGNGFTVAISESSRLVDYDLTTTVQDETYLTRTYTTNFTAPMMYVNPEGDTPQVVIGYSYPGMTTSIAYNDATFYYSTDGENYSAYSEPIALDNTIDKVYAYAKVRNVQSPTITGKYIHLLDVPTSLVMGETYTPTFTQPTEADGFTFDETKIVYGTSNENVATYANGVVTAVAIGTAKLSINLQEALVMNNNTQQPTVYPLVANDGVLEFNVNIVPEAPAISVEGGTYEEAQRVTLSSDYVRNHPQTASIKYYLGDDSENVQTYSNKTLYIDNTTTLHAWVEVQEESDAPVYKSEVKTESYTILHRADIKWMVGDTDYNYEIDGTTVQADANGNYRDTNGKEPWFNNPDEHEVVFNSTDKSVATVDSEGKITIVGMGKTTISATVAANAEMIETTVDFTLMVNPEVVTFSEGRFALLYVGDKVTITCPQTEADIYYYYGNQSKNDAVKYTGPVELTNTGSTTIQAFARYTKNDEIFESGSTVSGRYEVFEEPTFSVASGTYNDGFEVTIGNLPKNDGTVYYYFNDDEANRVEYNAGDKVSVTESKTLKVYIEKNDSGQYYKTKPVEAEYVIRQDAGLAYTQNNEAVEVAEYTIGGKDNEDLPELTNTNNLAVTYSSSDEQVATIDATGKVTIVGVGEATITATSEQTATLLAGEASYLLTVYKNLSHESITVSVATATYTGEAVEPEVIVMDGETDITNLMNFSYADNIEVGNGASVTIVPNNDLEVNFYVGSRTETFSIINRTLEVGKDVTFANGQNWASFYTTTENLELPEGVMAYIVTGVANSAVSVKAINYVPKSVPVLIENESTATTDNASAEGNLLRGTAESTAVSDIEGNVYVLYNGGFTRATSGSIPAHRAYLVLEQNAGARLSIFDETTGIASMANGQQLKGNDQYYDLQGRKIESHAKKGLYIKNRRKVVVK